MNLLFRISCLVLGLGFSASSAMATHSILLSAYEPMRALGAKTNNSMMIAQGLAASLEANQITVSICRLPVAYDRAAIVLADCINKMPNTPDLILSFGEGDHCGAISAEMIYYNTDYSSLPDNEGAIRYRQPITAKGPEFYETNLPLVNAFSALKREDFDFLRINDWSNSLYVCNNTAYHIRHDFPDLRYGFFHIPPQECREGASQASKYIQVLSELSLAQIQAIDSGVDMEVLDHAYERTYLGRLLSFDTEAQDLSGKLNSGMKTVRVEGKSFFAQKHGEIPFFKIALNNGNSLTVELVHFFKSTITPGNMNWAPSGPDGIHGKKINQISPRNPISHDVEITLDGTNAALEKSTSGTLRFDGEEYRLQDNNWFDKKINLVWSKQGF